jgi:hypothetical protein
MGSPAGRPVRLVELASRLSPRPGPTVRRGHLPALCLLCTHMTCQVSASLEGRTLTAEEVRVVEQLHDFRTEILQLGAQNLDLACDRRVGTQG